MSFPRARFPKKSEEAAFMEAKEPDRVVAASFEVVPVMSSSP